MSKISIAEEDAIRTELRKKIDDKTGPLFIRLAFHTLVSYDEVSKTIALDFGDSKNGGLKAATKLLDSVEKNHPKVSKCDLWSLAGVIAVEVMGGPKIPWKFGRNDAKDGINREQHIPGIRSDPDDIRGDFGPLGLSERDIVALIGAHTVGRSHQKFENGEGKWTEQNNRFTNEFYVNLEKASKNKLASVNLASKNSFPQGPPDMIMLSSDLALFRDPKFKVIAEEYAKNQKKFFDDFAEAFGKLLRRSLP